MNAALDQPTNLGPVVLSADKWNGQIYTPPIPNDILTAERSILTQIQANIDSRLAEVNAFPADWKNYRANHPNATILVRFAGSKYAPINATDIVVQWRTMSWQIVIISRTLSSKFGGVGDAGLGAYNLIELVRRALTGFQMPGFRKAYPTDEEYNDYEPPHWTYQALYAFPTIATEQDVISLYPLLATVTVNEVGGQTLKVAPVTSQTFSGSPSTIALSQKNVSSVVVSDPTSHRVFVAGVDYSVDTVNGIVNWIATGGIGPGATVNVGFNYADIITAIASGGTAPTTPTN